MHLPHPSQPSGRSRPGKILVLFGLLLPALLGMTGLVIDVGLVLAAQRQVQNAADAAALVAAMHLMRGDGQTPAQSAATTAVQQHNGLTGATVSVNFADAITAGPYKGQAQFVEVLVTFTVNTWFIRVLGPTQATTKGRAVAGFQPVGSGEGAIVLDPRARPGLAIDGGATLKVQGAVVVNSRGAGWDQYGTWVDWGYQSYALTTSNNSTVQAGFMQVRGGVDTVANYKNIDPNGPCPLFCRAGIAPDPLANLPVPTAATGADLTLRGEWTVGQSDPKPTYLDPGVYEDIQINQGAEVIFRPGIYILSPKKPNQGLRINGDCTVTGDGVLFYATGSNYLDNGAGYYDTLDGPVELNVSTDSLPDPPDPGFNGVKFATVDINATGATITLKGLKDTSSPYFDLLFFQRRRNENAVSIQGNAGQNVTLGGTIYAKWANFKLAGEGKYDAQFVVGSMSISGQALVVINSGGKNWGRANQVFLVE